jgi:hypothetical protein
MQLVSVLHAWLQLLPVSRDAQRLYYHHYYTDILPFYGGAGFLHEVLAPGDFSHSGIDAVDEKWRTSSD